MLDGLRRLSLRTMHSLVHQPNAVSEQDQKKQFIIIKKINWWCSSSEEEGRNVVVLQRRLLLFLLCIDPISAILDLSKLRTP